MQNRRIDLTQGPILKGLISLALPIIGANILQTGYQLVDAFWVGRLGANAVAAVSVSFPVNFLLISLTSGFAFAGTILVAQYAGAKNYKMVNHTAQQTLSMVVLLSLIISLLAYALSPHILSWLGVGQDIFEEANYFQRIIFLALTFNFSFIMFQSLLRGVGEVRIPLYINGVALALNFILDPLFIYGYGPIPAAGVAGAAYSTMATLALSSIAGFFILFKGSAGIKLSFNQFKIDKPLLARAFKLGTPSSIEISARALGLTVLTGIAAQFGTEVLAAYGVGSRLISFVVIFGLGLLRANSTLVGQNMGARKIERAEKGSIYAAWIGFVFLSFIGLLFYLFTEPIVRTFLDAEDHVVAMGVKFMEVVSLSFGFLGAQLALVGTLRGSGNTVQSMVLTLIGIWLIQFPFAYFAAKIEGFEELAVWYSFPISYILPCILTVWYFKRGKWKNKQVV
ncbi:MATE family efflux transporter [Luteibaculum oceani]|uniref:MATE family efflux transporter n=1 Tax=Luteibaculum oceani TaxID=1294296 RepID=A0A5C6V4F9_9FLAO|nr:MATE family efflux transporter [Luteibaculum oceani]TXC78335.1 MATE family efflux transporter [Luteibaculum oceani]